MIEALFDVHLRGERETRKTSARISDNSSRFEKRISRIHVYAVTARLTYECLRNHDTKEEILK